MSMAAHLELHIQRGPLGDLAEVPAQDGREPQIIEVGGAQI